ncbi:chitinase [Ruicaihuangia caeni]|uniref:Chitinase n=1 Tax=Ruicaihuangia caeni TaxID=3042517 RepID=A0AAW6T4D2_9MICO|nr:chitinase [Klugiella sp. YN-L-19]MDI2098169.1 chitinase [Klugiella sp. YN-L-19]
MTAGGTLRLSFWRVIVAVIVLSALIAGSFFVYKAWASARTVDGAEAWFAGYADVTATPSYAFESPIDAAANDVVLAFIVADPTEGCEPTWGGAYSLDEAAEQLDLDRRLVRLEQAGGGYTVSFGGLNNDELATSCTDPDELRDAYRAVIDRYKVTTVDFDIEANDLSDTAGGERRAEAVAELQSERRSAGDELAVWLTLPGATFGLTEEGTDTVARFLEAGVDLAGVNVMTMNFGASRDKGETLGEASIRAAEAAHRQLSALYTRAGTPLSDAAVWAKIGITPMIGQNDNAEEVFLPADAEMLNTFALEKGVGRMSMWSLNRDTTCGANYVTLSVVSDSCSGIEQKDFRFAQALAKGLSGTAERAAGLITTFEPVDPDDLVDDPATSPYQIWSEEGTYLAGTKVVWHRNVYRAKWWTSGDLPDNPVLVEWETPWELIGPVLPGETPVEPPTLPDGTYPEWAGAAVYEKDARVLFDGIPFQAKWWNQGESPAAASSNPDGSPWTPLSVADIEAVLEELGISTEE